MALSFAGKRVLVTGASKGIGQACAVRLLELGAHVIALGRDEAGLGRLVGEVTPILADCSDAVGLARALEAEAGDVDLLVNNAGIAANAPVLEVTVEDWDATMAINCRAALLCAQYAAGSMIRREVEGGAIVNVSSQAALAALDEHAAYCASKAAMDALTRQLALELGPFGIRANSVNPTVTLTEMAAREWSDEAKAAPMKSRIPLGRFAETRDVVDAVAYLLSDGAALVSGAALPVDGGFLASPFNNAPRRAATARAAAPTGPSASSSPTRRTCASARRSRGCSSSDVPSRRTCPSPTPSPSPARPPSRPRAARPSASASAAATRRRRRPRRCAGKSSGPATSRATS